MNLYELKDRPSVDERAALGFEREERFTGQIRIMAQSTGKRRCPQKGEWYLSGAIVEAYKAWTTLTCNPELFIIAELVRVEVKTVVQRRILHEAQRPRETKNTEAERS